VTGRIHPLRDNGLVVAADDRAEQRLAVRFDVLNDLDPWHSRYVRVKLLSTLE